MKPPPASAVIDPEGPFTAGVTVAVMAYNEVAALAEVVAEIKSVLGEMGPDAGEVLIIDDGSTDGTGELADELASRDHHIRTIHHPTNLGLGEVYRAGLIRSEREFVTFFPADGQFPASIIPRFFRLAQTHDLVLGFLSNREDWLGQALSWMQRLVYRALVGRLPRFQGVLMLRRQVLQTVRIMPSGRAATVVFELILKVVRGGYRVTSVPTEHRPRKSGGSKVNNWRTIRSNLVAALALRHRMAASDFRRGQGPEAPSGVGGSPGTKA